MLACASPGSSAARVVPEVSVVSIVPKSLCIAGYSRPRYCLSYRHIIVLWG